MNHGSVGAVHRTATITALFYLIAVANAAPLAKDGVTLRVIESGVFRSGLVQGMEVDLLNESDKPVTVDIQLILHRDGREVKRSSETGVTLPAHARQGFRVAEPLIFGKCKVTCDVKVDGAAFASDSIQFESSGPYRVTTRPWLLTRNAVQVMLELLDPTTTKADRFRFSLFDADRKKVLFRTEQCERVEEADPAKTYRPRVFVQSFVEFGRNRPGSYVVEVEVLNGETAAARMCLLVSNEP